MSEENTPTESPNVPDVSPEVLDLRVQLANATTHAGLYEALWHAEKAMRENAAVANRTLEEALRAATSDLQRARTKLGAYTEHLGKLITIVEANDLGEEAEAAAKDAFSALGEP